MPLFSRWEADEVMLHLGNTETHLKMPLHPISSHHLPGCTACPSHTEVGTHWAGGKQTAQLHSSATRGISSSSKHHLLQVLLDSVSFQLPVSFISPSGFRVASPGLARSFCELFPFYCSSFLSNELCRSLQAHLRLRTFLFSGLILCL